jgi:hypothetical protein
MKRLLLIVVVIGFISCNTQKLDSAKLIDEHKFLMGTWKGDGKFLDKDLHQTLAALPITLEIKPDYTIDLTVAGLPLSNINLYKAKYGFEIKGTLHTDVTNGKVNDKKNFILLFIIPENADSTLNTVDANFHLKSNVAFDATMKVGGVILRKTNAN